MIEEIKNLLRPLFARRLSQRERRELAQALRDEAERQERLADAQRADIARPAPQRLRPAGAGGRPGAMHVYLDVREDRGRAEPTYTLRIGRGVYDAYQAIRLDPRRELRLAPQIVGSRLYLIEDVGGYLLMINQGGIRLNVSGSRDDFAALPVGVRWRAMAYNAGIMVDLS